MKCFGGFRHIEMSVEFKLILLGMVCHVQFVCGPNRFPAIRCSPHKSAKRMLAMSRLIDRENNVLAHPARATRRPAPTWHGHLSVFRVTRLLRSKQGLRAHRGCWGVALPLTLAEEVES